jgi:6,7-dimethyl-8-ribityllumazine synthase
MPRSRSVSSNGRAVPPRIAAVVSRYNASITDRLLEGARNTLRVQSPDAEFEVLPAPGSFELPALALAAAQTGRFHGIVALGCLIKGETAHDRVIADAVAHGLVQVTIATGIPVTFGVLTVDTPDQAQARAGGAHGNKGADAMIALLETLAAIDALQASAQTQVRVLVSRKPDKATRKPGRIR